MTSHNEFEGATLEKQTDSRDILCDFTTPRFTELELLTEYKLPVHRRSSWALLKIQPREMMQSII